MLAQDLPFAPPLGPFGTIDMGGMFSWFKVRDCITTYDDPGWYDHRRPPSQIRRSRTSCARMALPSEG